MILPPNKTKIVATLGPASNTQSTLEHMIRAGMNVARLNFSHGEFDQHASVIRNVRAAAAAVGKRVAIMADLPGPKMRLGEIPGGGFDLVMDDKFVLTNEEIDGDHSRASMSFEPLPRVVRVGDQLFLNDGLVQLEVERVDGNEVHTRVVVGGPVSSRKGLNLPRIALGIRAFTDRDAECLEFALDHGVDAVSQSFVENAEDMHAVREAATRHGKTPFLIAKIERWEAVQNYHEILEASDGIMVARGDLGVEVPIEDMAVIQKRLITQANLRAKPVITATHMLESMMKSRLPTRAEATDVANAILDGTDCVMLSGESAVGAFPVESVQMLARIAVSAEEHRSELGTSGIRRLADLGGVNKKSLIIEHAIEMLGADAVLVPTRSGGTARSVARWKPSIWVLACGPDPASMQSLAFSSGVYAIDLPEDPDGWNDYARDLIQSLNLEATRVLLIAGPSNRNPEANQRLELIEVDR